MSDLVFELETSSGEAAMAETVVHSRCSTNCPNEVATVAEFKMEGLIDWKNFNAGRSMPSSLGEAWGAEVSASKRVAI